MYDINFILETLPLSTWEAKLQKSTFYGIIYSNSKRGVLDGGKLSKNKMGFT